MTDEQKPIFYQYRTRPTNDDKHPWSLWRECHEREYKCYLKEPVLHDRVYEVRALYTHPAPDVLRQLLNLLGPEAPACCGCAEEWQAAIDLIKRELE